MPKATLSAAMCATAHCPPGRRRVDYWDSQVPGFVLSVRANGGKTYVLRFIQNGRQREYRIAGYSDVTFDAARKAARRLRSEVVLGGDPSAARQQKKSIATYATLAAQHVAHAKASQKSWWSVEGIIRNHILPRWGRLRLDEITSQAIALWLAEKSNEGLKPATVEKIRVVLGRSFELGRQWAVPGSEQNPVRNVPRARFEIAGNASSPPKRRDDC